MKPFGYIKFIYRSLVLIGCVVLSCSNLKVVWASESISLGEEKMSDSMIPLLLPDVENKAFLHILSMRRTSKEFDSRELTIQTISELLWAAYGINRSEESKRTAPSAHNWQQIDVYVVDAKGLYLFDPIKPSLIRVIDKDIRDKTGIQSYAAKAPVNLVYVVDRGKMEGKQPEETKMRYSWATAGAIAQNVYLYCASEGLSSAVRADIEKEELHKKMKLRDDQEILLAQSVGYPASGLRRWLKTAIFSDK